MAKTVRIYESEQQAQQAVEKLKAIGLGDNMLLLLTPAFGSEESSVGEAIASGGLPGTQVNAATQALRNGRSVVSVELPYGAGQRVDDILASCNPVDSETLVDLPASNPAPLSDFFGIPTLLSGASSTKLLSGPKERSLGFPLLTRGGKPMFGGVKPFRKNSSFGFKLLTSGGRPTFPTKLMSGR